LSVTAVWAFAEKAIATPVMAEIKVLFIKLVYD